MITVQYIMYSCIVYQAKERRNDAGGAHLTLVKLVECVAQLPTQRIVSLIGRVFGELLRVDAELDEHGVGGRVLGQLASVTRATRRMLFALSAWRRGCAALLCLWSDGLPRLTLQ